MNEINLFADEQRLFSLHAHAGSEDEDNPNHAMISIEVTVPPYLPNSMEMALGLFDRAYMDMRAQLVAASSY